MFTLNCNGRLLSFDGTVIMGVVNITPDSFYADSRFMDEAAVLNQVDQMVRENVDIVDIGGQSTRPGAHPLTSAQELERIIKPIIAIGRTFPDLAISVDTYHARVAQEAVRAGAFMINDISGGFFDESMLSVVSSLRVPYVCMHAKGTPQTMHQRYRYEDISCEILDYFVERIDTCRKAGIHDIIVDPGFGFGKSAEQNFTLLKKLAIFKILQRPIMIGVSRKSTIYKTLGVTPEEALNGTTVLHTLALLHKVDILRVHDVKEAREVITLLDRLNGSESDIHQH